MIRSRRSPDLEAKRLNDLRQGIDDVIRPLGVWVKRGARTPDKSCLHAGLLCAGEIPGMRRNHESVVWRDADGLQGMRIGTRVRLEGLHLFGADPAVEILDDAGVLELCGDAFGRGIGEADNLDIALGELL